MPQVNRFPVGIDFMATMRPVPFRQLHSSALVLDDFPPASAVIGAKADFTLSQCDRSSRIADSREVVIEGVLEPHAVEDHESPTPVIRIGSLRPIIAITSNAIETIPKHAAKVAKPKPRRCFLLVEIAERRKPDKCLGRRRSSSRISDLYNVPHELFQVKEGENRNGLFLMGVHEQCAEDPTVRMRFLEEAP